MDANVRDKEKPDANTEETTEGAGLNAEESAEIASKMVPLKFIALGSFILLLWALALAAIRQTNILDLPSADAQVLLSGASSLALFVFSIALAILAIVGWREIKDTMREQAEKVVTARLGVIENELKGRAFTTMGYISGEMSLEYREDFIKVVDPDRLSEALQLLKAGYKHLRATNDQAKYMALNNLLFYSVVDGEETLRAEYLVREAEDLRRVGQEHSAANLILTANGVILRFSDDKVKRQGAVAEVEKLLSNQKLPPKRQKEARYYLHLASLPVSTAKQTAPTKDIV